MVLTRPLTDTGQTLCYDKLGSLTCPWSLQDYWGQDGNYLSTEMSYTDNGDGTVTDLVTGLTWTSKIQTVDSLSEGLSAASSLTTAGQNDWRVPTIYELYTLINFYGVTPQGMTSSARAEPYLSTDYFEFEYGISGTRVIDTQFLSSTEYVYKVMNRNDALFGVNFADGRIKGYPISKTYGVFFVRGDYGSTGEYTVVNNDIIEDSTTGLQWQKGDSGEGLDWPSALKYCNNLELGGFSDFRLPNAKELQSIVDYTRSPDTTSSPAIDSIFDATSFTNEAGDLDWYYYWTSTTHLDGNELGTWAVYVAFGRALGWFQNQFMDVHGAGCQRSDPKTGITPDPTDSIAPQGDIVRIYNMVRCVRGGDVEVTSGTDPDTRFGMSYTYLEEPTTSPPVTTLTTSPPFISSTTATPVSTNSPDISTTLAPTSASPPIISTSTPTNSHTDCTDCGSSSNSSSNNSNDVALIAVVSVVAVLCVGAGIMCFFRKMKLSHTQPSSSKTIATTEDEKLHPGANKV